MNSIVQHSDSGWGARKNTQTVLYGSCKQVLCQPGLGGRPSTQMIYHHAFSKTMSILAVFKAIVLGLKLA